MKFFLTIAAMSLALSQGFATFYSQYKQDEFVYRNWFNETKGGVFVDIGANDGITFSNTLFFEKEQGWTGLCIEPIPEMFEKLIAQRACSCTQGCVTDKTGKGQLLLVLNPVNLPEDHHEMLSGLMDKFDPRHLDRIQSHVNQYGCSTRLLDVDCYLLNDLLEQKGITHVNFLSIDTEGGEFDILAAFDFSKYQVDVIAVEDNYDDARFIPFLSNKGFRFVGRISCDLIFVRKNLKATGEVSI